MPRSTRVLLGSFATASAFALGAPMVFMSAGGAAGCGEGWATSGGTLPPGGGRIVGASTFGGSADPDLPGSVGAGGELSGHLAFAELSSNWRAPSAWDFAALGDLPMGTRLRITANGRSVVAVKRDVGRGGPPVGQPPADRAVDLWW